MHFSFSWAIWAKNVHSAPECEALAFKNVTSVNYQCCRWTLAFNAIAGADCSNNL